MKLEDIVKAWLHEHGYDGLYDPDLGCGCDVEHLMPCGEPGRGCEAGHKGPCTCGDCDFHIGPHRERGAGGDVP